MNNGFERVIHDQDINTALILNTLCLMKLKRLANIGEKKWLGLNKGQMGAQFSTFRRTPRFFFLSIADDLIFELMKLAPAT